MVQAVKRLQARAVEDLHVDGKLTATIVEDKDTDAATARLKSVLEAGPKVGLVDDSKALLDIAGLSHGNNVSVSHVEDTVLLEDGTKHGLDNNTGSRVRNEGGLLVKLLGKEVDTEVAVLSGSGRGRDADNLARTALEDYEVAETDVVAGDGNRVGLVSLGRIAGTGTGGDRSGGRGLDGIDFSVTTVAARVGYFVSKLVQSMAEGVVVTCTGH